MRDREHVGDDLVDGPARVWWPGKRIGAASYSVKALPRLADAVT
jgi:hypothetical protein